MKPLKFVAGVPREFEPGDILPTDLGGTGLSAVGDDGEVLTASGGALAYARADGSDLYLYHLYGAL